MPSHPIGGPGERPGMDDHGRRARLGVRCRGGLLGAGHPLGYGPPPPPQDFWPHRSYPFAATGGKWCGQSKDYPPCSLVGHGLGHRLPDGRDPDCRCDSFGYFITAGQGCDSPRIPLGSVAQEQSSGLLSEATLELCNHKDFILADEDLPAEGPLSNARLRQRAWCHSKLGQRAVPQKGPPGCAARWSRAAINRRGDVGHPGGRPSGHWASGRQCSAR